MTRTQRILSSPWTDAFYLFVTLMLAVLLVFWQVSEVQLGTEEYRAAMDAQANTWLAQLDLPFAALDELLSVPDGVSTAQEGLLLGRRMDFWNRHTEEPGLVRSVLKVTLGVPVGRFPEGHGPVTLLRLDAGVYKPVTRPDLSGFIGGLADLYSTAVDDFESHILVFNGRAPYLAVSGDDTSFYLLELDQEIFFHAFLDHVTKRVFGKDREATKGFTPAVLDTRNGTKVLYSLDSRGTSAEPYLMVAVGRTGTKSSRQPSQDPAWAGEFRQLRIDESYFLENWLNHLSAQTLKERNPSDSKVGLRSGIVFAYLPQIGPVGTLILLKDLPLFALGYAALALMGIALLTMGRYNRRMLRLMASREEFVSTMTHELRTPIHVISNGAGNLADGIVSDQKDVVRYGNLMKTEAERLSRMIESILAYSEVTRRTPTQQNFALDPLVGEVLAPYQLLCRELGIGMEEAIQPGIQCRGNLEAVRLILSNLLSNAVKHGGSGRWIFLSVTMTDELEMTVEDRGPGIPRHELARITDPFYRGGKAGPGTKIGSGLGLSIVKRITDAEKGRLDISSAEGGGSRFTVRLPYKTGEANHHE